MGTSSSTRHGWDTTTLHGSELVGPKPELLWATCRLGARSRGRNRQHRGQPEPRSAAQSPPGPGPMLLRAVWCVPVPELFPGDVGSLLDGSKPIRWQQRRSLACSVCLRHAWADCFTDSLPGGQHQVGKEFTIEVNNLRIYGL